MKSTYLIIGGLAVGVGLYDSVNLTLGAPLPFIWQGAVAETISELWLVIIGAMFLFLAAL